MKLSTQFQIKWLLFEKSVAMSQGCRVLTSTLDRTGSRSTHGVFVGCFPPDSIYIGRKIPHDRNTPFRPDFLYYVIFR